VIHRSRKRHERALKAELSRNLSLFFFESTEINTFLEDIASLGREPSRKALALCVFLSNVSASIVPRVVRHLKDAAAALPADELERWISRAFDLLDKGGVEPASRFLEKTDDESMREFMSPAGLPLEQVVPKLERYLRGVSGMDLGVQPARNLCYTNTSDIFLPEKIAISRGAQADFLLFKLLSSHLWAQIATGTFTSREGGGPSEALTSLTGDFDDKALAVDLFRVLEAERSEEFLKNHLPGLIRDTKHVKRMLLETLSAESGMSEKTAFVNGLFKEFLSGSLKTGVIAEYRKQQSPDPQALKALYDRAASCPGAYRPRGVLLPCGIMPEEVAGFLQRRRSELGRKVEGLVSRLMDMPEREFHVEERRARERPGDREPGEGRKFIVIRGARLEVDEELEEIIRESDAIAGAVVVEGSETGGGGRLSLRSLLEEEEEETARAEAGLPYDEWDFRRSGYRKGWCSLFEHDVHPLQEPFVEHTLSKYGGYVIILRKKFELLRNEVRTLKRQKEGEEIDIDAAVEAMADHRAGLAPREDVFCRLHRDERNIATLFLLDMSGSTKGWINIAEKEALVLMCEALETLRDRYAIYGFSGMTRVRCDFYRIKGFDEQYSSEVKSRISGILPKDYTRMGPAIRHATNILDAVEARTKLMITLSDGKPEDYDAYKGHYGIEDTRMALAEAREKGIHSFCITIDREAHEYLPHMYGDVNYTFIDDVKRLPARITDIYTRITT
jgi:nitric oxide reductase NorD protein